MTDEALRRESDDLHREFAEIAAALPGVEVRKRDRDNTYALGGEHDADGTRSRWVWLCTDDDDVAVMLHDRGTTDTALSDLTDIGGAARDERLRAMGFDAVTEDQRQANLDLNLLLSEWAK